MYYQVPNVLLLVLLFQRTRLTFKVKNAISCYEIKLKPVYHYFISNALLEKIEPPVFTLRNHPLELNIVILLPLSQESISKQPLCARRNFTTIRLYLQENVGNDRGNINNFIFLGPICTNFISSLSSFNAKFVRSNDEVKNNEFVQASKSK